MSMKSRRMTGRKRRHKERELFKEVRHFHSISMIPNLHTVHQTSFPFILSTVNVNL